jgi:CRISPR-associated protein Csy1
MSEEQKEFQTWEEVIVDFFTKKKTNEEIIYLKDRLKITEKVYKKQFFFGRDDIKFLFDPKKYKKSKDQSDLDFQQEKFNKSLELNHWPDGLDGDLEKIKYQDKISEISEKYHASSWISESAKKASSVSFATHVIKLTHSAIGASSLLDTITSTKDAYLTTSNLKKITEDGAVIGNQNAPIYQFLALECNGEKLAATFSKENCRSLEAFATNEDQLSEWNKGFKQALLERNFKSHFLAKQIYFPISNNTNQENADTYHLLCNIVSSSLAQSIYESLDDRENSGKKQKEEGKFTNQPYSLYMSKAVLKVTASNHSNASQLNGKRGGRLILLNSQPPTWQSQLKPPIEKKSLFSELYLPAVKNEIKYLREFLLRFERIDLSINDPQRFKWIERWLGNIIDELLNYIVSIQHLSPGWSSLEKIELKPEHQYLLDPFYDDVSFQAARRASNWQAGICDDFGWWLNQRLRGKDKKFTPQAEHRRLWAKQLETPLREHHEMVEAQRKQQKQDDNV